MPIAVSDALVKAGKAEVFELFQRQGHGYAEVYGLYLRLAVARVPLVEHDVQREKSECYEQALHPQGYHTERRA